MPNSRDQLQVVFAVAEAAPIARVGGLAEAAGGLARSLRRSGEVDLVMALPDYGDVSLVGERRTSIDVPAWVGEATVRSGQVPELGRVHLISVEGMERAHPYVDGSGVGWPDNDARFFRFSAAVAAIVRECQPDVVHLHDWHAATTLAMIDQPTVFTIHTLGYQGQTDPAWFGALADGAFADRLEMFLQGDHLNPMAGAIALADKVTTVSPTYASEILDPHRGAGLHLDLAKRGDDLVGIRNGIDTELWDPAIDDAIASVYNYASLRNKVDSRTALLQRAGWPEDDGPLIGIVSRLVEQKGIDIALGTVPYLEGMGARLFVLGSGEDRYTRWAADLQQDNPDRIHFVEGYDVDLARQVFAGVDLFCMPSRFEPGGLAQMQAMQYGAIPVVTPVGGLVDTVIDVDEDPLLGNGFVTKTIDTTGLVDALHRATNSWRSMDQRRTIQCRGMTTDWSWDWPTEQFLDLYRDVVRSRSRRTAAEG